MVFAKLRWLIVVPISAVAASCGGATSGESGNGAAAGAAGAGFGAVAGSAAGRGGSGSGAGGGSGTVGTGGAGSGSASGGTGGVGPSRCTLAVDPGPCEGAMPRFFNDPVTGVCEPFVYGGCGGNENRFSTLAECQAVCSSGQPQMDACRRPGDCVLTSRSCCGGCEPIDPASFASVNAAFRPAYMTTKGCDLVKCGGCPPTPELSTTFQYFIPTCDAGYCGIADLREHDVTSCARDADCVLRDGANCCEGCDGRGLVAINKSGDLTSLVCGADLVGCPACAPPISSLYVARCELGRCVVGSTALR